MIKMSFMDLFRKYREQLTNFWHKRMKPLDMWIVINKELIRPPSVFDKPLINSKAITFIKRIKNLPDDYKAYKCHYFILEELKIKYKRDLEAHDVVDYWQSPEETIKLGTGDCEDFTILWMKLMQMLNVPSYKCLAVMGMISSNGRPELHLYPVYFTGIRSVNMDLTAYTNLMMVGNRPSFRVPNDLYLSFWWSFNWRTCYRKLHGMR